jgi:DNA-binding LacI/PurR family transcriptional regulator
MADVAARAGVSRALVSTVFRDVPGAGPKTRARVLQAAADLGYRMDNRARMLRRSRTQLLGVMFQVQDAFQSDLVEALYPAAMTAGYDLVLSATTPDRDELHAAQSLLDDRCEALLLLGPQLPDQDLMTLSNTAPTIVVSRRVRQADNTVTLDVVRTPDSDVVTTAMSHLLDLGHRAIAHVDGGGFQGASDRRRCYGTAMRRHGLAEHTRVVTGGYTEADGTSAARDLMASKELPTAVLAFNDRCAVGLMFELRRAGVDVPGDVSVMGYDDVSMAALPFIDLTTVGQDQGATAARAVERAVARLDQSAPPAGDSFVPPYLVRRGTTGPPH